MLPLSMVKALRTAWQDLKQDLKSTRWLRGLGWLFGVLWMCGLLTSAIMIPLFATFSSPDTACLPDNSFRLHPDTYNGLSSSGFFQITLSSGKLTFAQAKAIDILWDVGVGRGGQLLLAIISWREFARYLTICMETEPITFQVFRTIFLEKDASIFSAVRVSRSLVWQRRLRSKVAMTFIIATMLFIVALPTLVSAMSGYDANVASRILDRDDNLIPFNNFSRVLYVIHDGWRIGKDGNSWITDIPSQEDPVLRSPLLCLYSNRKGPVCDLLNSVSAYVEAYGLDGKYNGISQFENRTISPPALNISAYEHDSQSFWGYNVSGLLNTTWVRGNETFDYAYIEANGKCQNIGDYRWGFSFWQLFICIMLLLAWTVGIYIMWIYTHNTMALRNRHTEDVAGEYRAVLELAAAMQADLDIEDTDLSVLREKQLKERIDKEARGGAIAYAYSSSLPNTHGIRKGLAAWFKIEKWWFLAIFTVCSTGWLFLLVPPVMPLGICLWSWTWAIFLGQVWAFCIGTTTGSRLLIISFWGLLGGIAVVGPLVVTFLPNRS